MKKISLLLAFFVCIGINSLFAQNMQVTGTVTSGEDGSGIPGATIKVKGGTTGVVTDLDGKYTISVSPEATLVVSFVGLKTQEVAVAGQKLINVTLQSDVVGLDEVVVTAMGMKKSQKALGYSATTVSNDDFTKTGDRSMMNALQGKIAGANISGGSAPGASSRVILRGLSSLGGSNQPLYVVDGVPISNGQISQTDINSSFDFGNRANDINPDDIESVTVLKGASGTSLYGSRAANGVIVITTKNGKASKNGGAKIEFSNASTFETPLRLPEMQNEFGQGWYDGTVAANLEENGSWGPKFDGVVRPWGHVVDNSQQIKPYVALKNNWKDFFEVGTTYNNSISISNGDDKSTYYLSYSNVTSDGIVPTSADSYKRNTLSLRGSTKFKEKFNISGSLNYVRKDSKFVPTGQEQSVMDALFQTPRDISIVDQKDYKNKFNNVDNYYTVFAQNPYYVLNEHGNKFNENRIFGNTAVDYNVTSWLKATFRAGGDVSNSTLKQWRAITKSTRADYTKELGRVSEASYYTSEINTDFILSFNKQVTDKFDVSAVLGHNFNQRDARDQAAEVIGLDIPYFYNLSNSSSTPTVSESISKRRLIGAYGTIDLSWDKWIYLTLSGRNDWSSTLPKDSRSFFYPSVSMSFLLSDLLPESFKSIVSLAKIRGGIAKTGNDASPYQVNSVFTQAGPTDGYRNLNFPLAGNINGFTLSNRIGNPTLQPEISTEKEIGADLRFFQSRINLDVAYYDKKTTDLIWPVSLSSATGYTTQTMNLGEITNKGIELSLKLVPVKTKDFEWNVTWTFSKNENKLVSLTEGLDQVSLGGTSSVGFIGVPGQALGLFEGLVPEMHNGKVVVNSTGLPVSSTTRQIYGGSQYKYITGGGTELSWKGLSLNAVVDYRHGGLMYSRTAEMQYFTGNAPQTTFNDRQPFIIPNSVQKLDDGTYVENTTPISGHDGNMNLYYNQTYGAGQFGRLYLIDKTFFKLRELSISYRLPKSILPTSYIQDAQISLIGRNLFLWTPSSNNFVDPESTTFSDSNGLRAEYGEYGAIPSTRSYGFSVKLTF